jgi:hypothetical protein
VPPNLLLLFIGVDRFFFRSSSSSLVCPIGFSRRLDGAITASSCWCHCYFYRRCGAHRRGGGRHGRSLVASVFGSSLHPSPLSSPVTTAGPPTRTEALFTHRRPAAVAAYARRLCNYRGLSPIRSDRSSRRLSVWREIVARSVFLLASCVVFVAHFASVVTAAGFFVSAYDPALFVHVSLRGRTLLILYVDDIIITGDDHEYVAVVKAYVSDQFLCLILIL